MGSRLLRLGGLLAAASLLVVGCAGEADDIDESESPLTVPPPTSESPTADAVLDLETMTDEELLAEAERAYQGFLDDVAELHENNSRDYLSLDQWATGDFLDNVNQVYGIDLPEELRLQGVQEIRGVELWDPHLDDGRLMAEVCLDNSTLRVLDEAGTDITSDDAVRFSSGLTEFKLSSDSTHLRVANESSHLSESTTLCA